MNPLTPADGPRPASIENLETFITFSLVLSVLDILLSVSSIKETTRESQEKGGRASMNNCDSVVHKRNRMRA